MEEGGRRGGRGRACSRDHRHRSSQSLFSQSLPIRLPINRTDRIDYFRCGFKSIRFLFGSVVGRFHTLVGSATVLRIWHVQSVNRPMLSLHLVAIAKLFISFPPKFYD